MECGLLSLEREIEMWRQLQGLNGWSYTAIILSCLLYSVSALALGLSYSCYLYLTFVCCFIVSNVDVG